MSSEKWSSFPTPVALFCVITASFAKTLPLENLKQDKKEFKWIANLCISIFLPSLIPLDIWMILFVMVFWVTLIYPISDPLLSQTSLVKEINDPPIVFLSKLLDSNSIFVTKIASCSHLLLIKEMAFAKVFLSAKTKYFTSLDLNTVREILAGLFNSSNAFFSTFPWNKHFDKWNKSIPPLQFIRHSKSMKSAGYSGNISKQS